MGETEIALAALGLLGTAMAALVWIVKYFAKTLSHDLKEHTKAAQQQGAAAERLRETVEIVGKNSQEHHRFMKALNGKLSKATIQVAQEVKEQNVEHQTIKQIKKG